MEKNFITWFDNIVRGTRLKIEFDRILTEKDVGTRFINPGMSTEEKKRVRAKPFLVKKPIRVRLWYHKNKAEEFTIPAGYTWDGATIPKIFRPIIGSPTYPGFLVASLIHDKLCENPHFINNDRYMSTIVFNALLEVAEINPLRRWAMKHSVDNFQKIFGGWN